MKRIARYGFSRRFPKVSTLLLPGRSGIALRGNIGVTVRRGGGHHDEGRLLDDGTGHRVDVINNLRDHRRDGLANMLANFFQAADDIFKLREGILLFSHVTYLCCEYAPLILATPLSLADREADCS
jgi:hypothetical protein